jgi:hypothetical protein
MHFSHGNIRAEEIVTVAAHEGGVFAEVFALTY